MDNYEYNINQQGGRFCSTTYGSQYNDDMIDKYEFTFSHNIYHKSMSNGDVIEINYVEPRKILGKGAFGTVYEARMVTKNRRGRIVEEKKCVIKVINNKKKDTLKIICGELITLMDYKSDNSVEYYGYSFHLGVDGITTVFLFMDHIDGMELSDFIDKKSSNDKIEFKQKIIIVKQLLDELENMHDHKIYHRDIKPQNIMINIKKGTKYSTIKDDQIKITYIDFGFGCDLDTTCDKAPWPAGTPYYITPDALKSPNIIELYEKDDIWALGCTIYFVLFGEIFGKVMSEHPSSLQQLYRKIHDLTDGQIRNELRSQCQRLIKEHPEYQIVISKIFDIMTRMLKKNREEREMKKLDNIDQNSFISMSLYDSITSNPNAQNTPTIDELQRKIKNMDYTFSEQYSTMAHASSPPTINTLPTQKSQIQPTYPETYPPTYPSVY